MPDSVAIDHQARAQIDRLRDSQDQTSREVVKLTAVIDAIRDRVERGEAAHIKALEELFQRMNQAEKGVEVSRSRWAMAGAGILVLCSSVTSFVVFVAGKIWP